MSPRALAWSIIGVIVAFLLGGVVAVVLRDAQHDRKVREWQKERDAYFADSTAKAVADLKAEIESEGQVVLALAAERDRLRDSIEVLKAKRRPVPALDLPKGVTVVPVTLVQEMHANWVEQLGLRDDIIARQDEAARVDSVAIASYDRQLVAMTGVAAIHQVKRTECEALLKKAPVGIWKPHLSAIGELEGITHADSLRAVARVGLSVNVRGMSVEGGAWAESSGPYGGFVRGRVKLKLL